MRLRKITFLFLLTFMLSTIMCETAYAGVPYNGYTYDAYGNSVPTAVCYEPDKYLTGFDIGVGALKNPEDMFVSDKNEVYILDSGNKRIIELDKELKVKKIIDKIVDEKGAKYELKNPCGIYVTEDKIIYIADTDNQRVISINEDGKIQKKYSKPTSQLFPQNVEFKPRKVVVDKAVDVYVVADGIYQGAVMYDKDTNFTGFYGTNKVEVNTAVLSDYFWKTFFMNKEQRRKTARYVPTTFTNFYIDKSGFIYVCSKDDTSKSNVLKKLNSLGSNILRTNKKILGYGDLESAVFSGNQIRSSFVDVNVDSEGFINVLDSTRGRVFQYDQDSNLIAIFGGKSNQVGTFNSPAAIATLNGKIIVLDNKRGDLTIYGLTEFGQWIHTAVKLYDDGLYEDSMEPWKEVLKRDNKLEIAYIGLGKAMLKAGDYKEAMRHFKLGYDVEDYSKAYGLYMSAIIRKNIGIIVTILALLFVSLKLLKRRDILENINKGYKYLKRKVKENLNGAG
jgi:tetratricopeptide (TPR) repeat protein